MANEYRTKAIVTEPYRMAFPALLAPVEKDNGKIQYEMILLIPKTDTEGLGKIKGIIRDAIKARWGDNPPKGLVIPLNDGDEKDWEGFAGHYYIRCASTFQPGFIDRQKRPIRDPNLVYGGAWVRAHIDAYSWVHQASGKKGVSIGLNNVLFWKEDESFGGTNSADDAFAEYTSSDAPESDDPAAYAGSDDAGVQEANDPLADF